MGRNAPWFDHWETTYRYVDLYERILQRPLVAPEEEKARTINKNGWNVDSHLYYNEQISTPAIAPI